MRDEAAAQTLAVDKISKQIHSNLVNCVYLRVIRSNNKTP